MAADFSVQLLMSNRTQVNFDGTCQTVELTVDSVNPGPSHRCQTLAQVGVSVTVFNPWGKKKNTARAVGPLVLNSTFEH